MSIIQEDVPQFALHLHLLESNMTIILVVVSRVTATEVSTQYKHEQFLIVILYTFGAFAAIFNCANGLFLFISAYMLRFAMAGIQFVLKKCFSGFGRRDYGRSRGELIHITSCQQPLVEILILILTIYLSWKIQRARKRSYK